jgi:hypothetical protein
MSNQVYKVPVTTLNSGRLMPLLGRETHLIINLLIQLVATNPQLCNSATSNYCIPPFFYWAYKKYKAITGFTWFRGLLYGLISENTASHKE